MGRPRGSFTNRQLALEFVEAVTAAVEDPTIKVARAGKFSLFEVFGRCCTFAVRHSDDGPQDGLSLQEFNKLVEKNGFIRVRKSPPAKGSHPGENFADPNNPDYTGAYAFAKRRWRDPDNSSDFPTLSEGWRSMQVLFCNEMNNIVPQEQFLDQIRVAKREGDRQAPGIKRSSESATSRTSSSSSSTTEHCGSTSPHGRRKRSSACEPVLEPCQQCKRQRSVSVTVSDAILDFSHTLEQEMVKSTLYQTPLWACSGSEPVPEAGNDSMWKEFLPEPAQAPPVLQTTTPKHAVAPDARWWVPQ